MITTVDKTTSETKSKKKKKKKKRKNRPGMSHYAEESSGDDEDEDNNNNNNDQQKQTNSKDNDVNLWKQREERPINSSIHRQNVATLNADEAAKAQEEMRKAELAKLQKEEIESFKNS